MVIGIYKIIDRLIGYSVKVHGTNGVVKFYKSCCTILVYSISLTNDVSMVIGASLSEPHHTIWPLEVVLWSMCKTDAIRNGIDRRTCHPL